MAATIDPATPLGSDAPSTIDDQIRALKQAIVDIFGLPSATTITGAPLLTATSAGLTNLHFRDAAANQSVGGYLGRDSFALTWGGGGAGQAHRISATIPQGLEFFEIGNVTGGEDNLHTASINAGTLFEDYRALRVTGAGYFAANGNTKTLRFYLGNNSFVINPTTTAPNNLSWYCQFLIGRSGASAQVLRGGIALVGAAQEIANLSLVGTQTMANALTVKFTGESAAAATNDIVQDTWLVEILN